MTDEEKKEIVRKAIYNQDRFTYSRLIFSKYDISQSDFERFADELVAEGKALKFDNIKSEGGQTGNTHTISWGPGYTGLK